MWYPSIKADYLSVLISKAISEFSVVHQECVFDSVLVEMKKIYPNCTDDEILSILQLCLNLVNTERKEHTELVITCPESFQIKSRKIRNVIKELLENAKESITFTGYSISDYFEDMVDTIIQKSQQGIYVTLYVNNAAKQNLERLLAYQGKYLRIFEYEKNAEDKMAALHAKIIVVDKCKSLVSSANLSYHGLKGNVELGLLITSEEKGKQIINVFKELTKMKVFNKYENTTGEK